MEFGDTALGTQFLSLEVTPESFERELASSRTFASYKDLAQLFSAGLAKGGSLDNAVILQQIKGKLLRKLSAMIDAYPEKNVAEMRRKAENGDILIYRMKDIAAVYAALEDKTVKASVDIEDLSPLAELLRDE